MSSCFAVVLAVVLNDNYYVSEARDSEYAERDKH